MHFTGTITSVEAGTGASEVLAPGDHITITGTSITVTHAASMPPYTWEPAGPSELGDHLIHGSLRAAGGFEEYSFVVCRGTKKLVGIIYRSSAGDPPDGGSDPGTWEADDEGGGET